MLQPQRLSNVTLNVQYLVTSGARFRSCMNVSFTQAKVTSKEKNGGDYADADGIFTGP